MMEDESGLFADEDEGLFADEDEGGAPAAPAAAAPWKVLIVDDDPEVHEVTKFALSGVTLGKGMKGESNASLPEEEKLQGRGV